MGFALHCHVLSSLDLPRDSVELGSLHAAPVPAPAHWMAVLPALGGEGQLQPGPRE